MCLDSTTRRPASTRRSTTWATTSRRCTRRSTTPPPGLEATEDRVDDVEARIGRFDEEFDDLWDDLAEVDTRLTDIEDRLGEDLDDVEAELDAINERPRRARSLQKAAQRGFRSITADRDDSIEIPREKKATRFTRGDPDPTMSEPVPVAVPRKGRPLEAVLERIAAVGPDDRLDGLADRVSNTLRYEKAVTKGRVVDAEDGPYERLIEYSDPDDPAPARVHAAARRPRRQTPTDRLRRGHRRPWRGNAEARRP